MMTDTNKLKRNKIIFSIRSGKNIKLFYYFSSYIRLFTPTILLRRKLNKVLESLTKRQDKDYIQKRVCFYNKMVTPTPLPREALSIRDNVRHFRGQKVYMHDSYKYARWFPARFRYCLKPGDNVINPVSPSIVKSRPIETDNSNAVLLNMDYVRHFIFVNDRMPFQKKFDKILFRGDIKGKPHRIKLFDMYFNHPLCDFGDTTRHWGAPAEWQKGRLTISEQLEFKFILSIEGNDVASNLKWIMSSNSVAVMPHPKFETWFMESTLIPGYHYIEIKKDYSDLIEKVTYYMTHPEETLEIIRHANEYVHQFKDKKRERLISLLVFDKYFTATGQRQEST